MDYKLSIGMPSLESEENYKYLNWAKKAGFDAIECEIAHPYEPTVRKIVRNGLNKYELELSGIRTGISYTLEGLCMSSKDPKVVCAAVERLIECNKMLVEYPNALNLIGMMQGKLEDMSYYPQARRQIVQSLRQICASAEKLGVKVSLEAVNHLIINYNNTIEEVARIINDVGSPVLGMLVDTFHMNIEEKSMVDPILWAGDMINHVHIADSNRWAPGEGHIDFDSFFEALYMINYKGWITVEADPKPDFKTMTNNSIEFIKKRF